jgi:hypothetical protein
VSPFVRNLLLLAAVAVAIVALNQETALVTAGLVLRVAFIIAIAVVAYFFWRDSARHEIELWPTRQQGVFYAAIALLVVDVGWLLMGHLEGRDALVVFVVAAVSAFVAVKTWLDQRRLL